MDMIAIIQKRPMKSKEAKKNLWLKIEKAIFLNGVLILRNSKK